MNLNNWIAEGSFSSKQLSRIKEHNKHFNYLESLIPAQDKR